jgi:hypothetical protein
LWKTLTPNPSPRKGEGLGVRESFRNAIDMRIKRRTFPMLVYRGIRAIATVLPRVSKYEYLLISGFLRRILEGINKVLSEMIKT